MTRFTSVQDDNENASPSQAGAVTSPHPLATAVGAQVLQEGGTAIEAAVAMGAMLTVVTPHFCGLGGDAVWLVADHERNRRCFLGIGQAAQAVKADGRAIPLRGPGSMLTTACLIDSWQHALDYSTRMWSGRKQLAGLIAPAIECAENGFQPGPSFDFWLDFRRQDIEQWPGFSALFDKKPGRLRDQPLRQPGVARILQGIANEGVRSFYEGKIAHELAEGFKTAGSPLSLQDLAATQTEECDPISIRYRDFELLAPPPPTQGISTLAIMGILSSFDMASLPTNSAARYHLIVEAVKQAFLDRELIAEPAFMEQQAAYMLSTERLQAKSKRIHRDRAMGWPAVYQHGDTVYLAAADASGRYASVLQSTYFDWGSGVVVGDTGILWQNRGAAFTSEPGKPNSLAPGKRPFYTLNPGIGLRNSMPHLAYGTQGADGQPQTLAVLLNSLIDHGMTPEAALSQGRFLLGRTFSDSGDNLKLEASLGSEVSGALAKRGHEVRELPALSPLFGQAGVIARDHSGGLQAAHDPRGEGTAMVVASMGN